MVLRLGMDGEIDGIRRFDGGMGHDADNLDGLAEEFGPEVGLKTGGCFGESDLTVSGLIGRRWGGRCLAQRWQTEDR